MLLRGYIAACPRNRLGAGRTVPERVRGKVLDMAAHRVLTRVLQVPNAARQSRYEDAIKFFDRVASCKFRLEEAEEFAEGPEASVQFPPPTVNGPQRQFNRRRTDGI